MISPGFAVDCLETLEEISIQYSELFSSNGGEKFEYIRCLNDVADQLNLFHKIINNCIADW